MSEPVKIVISETREGNAIDEEQRRIEQLHKAADQYAKTPGMEAASKSARSEALELQKKQLGSRMAREAEARAAGNSDAADQAAREAKEMERTMQLQRKGGMGYDQAAKTARRQLNQEDEAAALKKAGIEKMGYTRARQEAITLARELATGAPTGRTVSALLGNLIAGLAPEALIAGSAIAAPLAIAGGAYMFRRGEKEKDYQEQNKMREEQAGDERGQEIGASPLGSSSGSFQSEIGDETEIRKREADRGRLAHARKHAWFGLKDRLASLTGGRWKTQEQRDEEDNENEINRARRDKGAQKKNLNLQYKMGGGIDDEILKDTSEHSIDGFHKATIERARKVWMDTYKAKFAETGNSALASKVADMTVKEENYEQARKRGEGLVSTKTGNAGVAAAVAWASKGILSGDEMTRMLNVNHAQAGQFQNQLVYEQNKVSQAGKPLKE